MENQILPTSVFNENSSIKKSLSSKNIKQKDISSSTSTTTNTKSRSVFSDLSHNPTLQSSKQNLKKKTSKTKFKLYEDEEDEIEVFHKPNKSEKQKETFVFTFKDEDGKLKESNLSIENNLDELIKFPTTKFHTNQKSFNKRKKKLSSIENDLTNLM